MFILLRYILVLSLLVLLAPAAGFAATGMTYHGRIIKPNGQPLESAGVFLRIQIRSPGAENCLLFDEQQTLNMTGSNGIFVVTIGEGTRVAPASDGGYPMNKIFGNKGTLTGLTCNVGTTYAPFAADGRKLLVQFNAGTGWETLPVQNINYVPLAIEATQVSGYGKDQLLRVADGTVATEFSAANWTALWDLITGASTVYSKADGSNFNPAADVDFNGKKIIDLADPVAAQDAVTKNYADTRVGGKTADVAGVSALAGNGKVLVWNQALNKWEAGVPNDSTKLALTGDTMAGPINMGSFSVSNVGHVLIADQGTMYLGKFTPAQEVTLLATPLDNSADRGRTWFNTGTGKMRYWDGLAAHDVASKAYVDAAVSAAGTAANTYADTVSAAAETAAKGYADVNLRGQALAAPAGQPGKSIRWNAANTAWEYYTPSTGTGDLMSNGTVAMSADWDLNGATAGGTRLLTGLANPSVADGAATKDYVDSSVSTAGGAFVKKDATVALTADWDIDGGGAGTRKLTGLALPTDADGAVTKAYADGKILGQTLAAPAAGQVNQSIRWNAGNTAWEYYTPATGTGDLKSDGSVAMSADWDMNGATAGGTRLLTGLANPAVGDGASTKAYSDANLRGQALATPVGQAGKSIRWNVADTAWEYYTPATGNAMTTGKLDQFAATTSAELSTVISDETGTGLLVYGTAPTLKSFVLGGATSDGITMQVAATGATGTYTWPSALPAGNMVLQSSNTGALSWVSAASGTGDLKSDGSVAMTANWDLNGATAGGTRSLTGLADPAVADGAATKSYSDANLRGEALATPVGQAGKSIRWNAGNTAWEYFVAGDLLANGSVGLSADWDMNGATAGGTRLLTGLASPAVADGAATKGYVDSEVTTASGLFLKKDASVALTADWDIDGGGAGTRKLTGLALPTDADGAATKAYADGKILGQTLAAPAAGQVNQSIRWNAGNTAWEYYTPATGNAMTTGKLDQFAATTSAELATVLSDETGTGLVVYGTSPVLTTPTVKGFTLGGATSDGITMQVAATGATGTYTWPSALPAGNMVLQSSNTGALSWVAAASGTGDLKSDGSVAMSADWDMNGATAGGTRLLTGLAVPSVSDGAATKGYVDSEVSTASGLFLKKDASVALTADWDIDGAGAGTRKLTGLALPTDADGAVTKAYADGKILGQTLAAPAAGQVNQSIRWNAGNTAWEYYTPATGTGDLKSDGSVAMSADWDMNGATAGGTRLLTGLANPAVGDGASTKAYSDANLRGQALATPVGQAGKSIRWNVADTAWEYYTPATGNAMTTGKLDQFAATTSAELSTVISDETGTGLLVYGTAPTLKSFVLGGATSDGITMQVAATGATGTYTWPSALPAGNMVLQSSNTGALSWVSAASGTGDLKSDGSVAMTADWDMNGATAGGTRLLTGLASPAVADGAATKGYVDSEVTTASGLFLKKDASVALTADWDIDGGGAGTRKLTGLALPTDADGAATKAYADGKILGQTLAAPAAGQVNQSIRWNAGNTAWEYYTPATGNAMTTGKLDQFAATTSAELATVLSDETGTGLVVYGTSPVLTTPTVKGFTLGGATSDGITMQVAATGATGTYTWPSALPAGNMVLQSSNTGALSWVAAASGTGDLKADGSVPMSANWDLNGATAGGTRSLTGLADPAVADGASTKAYSDSNLRGNALATPVGQGGKSIRWNVADTAWEYFVAGDLLANGSVGLSADWDMNGATAGGTRLLTGLAVPSVSDGAATKGYVDSEVSTASGLFLKKDASVALTNDWDIDGAGAGTRKLTGLAAPTDTDGAATKAYADGKLLGQTLAAPGAGQVNQSIRWNAGNTAWEYYTPSTSIAADSLNFTDFSDALALDASTSITAPSGQAFALSVVNEGTGNSFLVGDEAADSSPFVIEDDGQVAIGTTTANALLTIEGVTSLREVAAPAATANYGKIYVKTDNKLYYMDDGGTEVQLGAPLSIADDSINFDKMSDALALDASTDIAADGAEVLSITNGGTGNSFLVNDATGGDTTPFVVAADGKVGVGLAVPTTSFEVVGDSKFSGGDSVLQKIKITADSSYVTSDGDLEIYTENAATEQIMLGAYFEPDVFITRNKLMVAGGSAAGTTGYFSAWTPGTGNNRAGQNLAISGGQSFGNANGGYISLSTAPAGAAGATLNAQVERMRIAADGKITIGNATANELLTVEGTTSLKAVAAPSLTAGYGKIYVDSGDSNKLKYMNPAGAIVDLSSAGAAIADDSLNFAKFTDSMALDASTSITAPSGQAYALSVVNEGTGSSFVVADENADTTPFVIDADGNITTGGDLTTNIITTRDGANTTGTIVGGSWMIADKLAAAMAGDAIVIEAGAPHATAVDENGGVLALNSGRSRGTGSSEIEFWTATAGGAGNGLNNQTKKMTILGNGNVGIGSAGNNGKLDVNGSIVMEGSTASFTGFRSPATGTGMIYTLPAADPTAGQVLSSTAAGVLSWIAPGGGAVADDSLDFTKFSDTMTLDAVTSITAPSGQAYALSLNNEGTGDSFRVNDVAADTTPFVVDQSGKVGVGVAAPATALDIGGQVKGAFVTHALANTNWNSGNIQQTSVAAGTLTFTSGSMYDGANYTLILTSAGTFTLDATGDITTWRCLPACSSNQIVASGHTVLTVIKAGSTGYVSWLAGF